MEPESTIDDIIKTVKRFRILSVSRSGVGKSSLINRVFSITNARVLHFKPGESDIEQEYISQDNPYFVLHDSKGFEPGDLTNFETVREFIEQRSNQGLPLRDRIHGLWLCTETSTAGGRVFEVGDDKLLELAQKTESVLSTSPVLHSVLIDCLVRTKKAELEEEHPNMDPATLDERSEDQARQAFKICVQSLQDTMKRLNILVPHYVKVSVRPGYKEDVSAIVEVTRDIVKERLKGDAWIMWAIAQRASLPVKIEACITKGMSYYKRVLTDVHTKPDISTSPNIDKTSQFVSLVTAASAPIVPPVAILGLTYVFLQWLSITALKNIPDVQRLLVAYTVDLTNVLGELFGFTFKPALALTTTWEELKRHMRHMSARPLVNVSTISFVQKRRRVNNS
ncbi:hypothetical protein D9756_010587 [Leucocoprinus leucothites]|uniref:G domain-containing protein n=1 Tax=Leucocoprinus leucothites TaxID=201217 RepID=A0A8H5CSJ9_9AGAR|nr:hypothetical protein D9756_010587 [Leucoagaricus leucothites]